MSLLSFAHVLFRDGWEATGEELARYCGVVKMAPVIFNNNKIRVEFISNESETEKGFNISYSTGRRRRANYVCALVGKYSLFPSIAQKQFAPLS